MSARSPFDVPLATYRLQFNRDFTFDRATAILPYLRKLGITHLYASPILRARAGSTHGYDIVDYHALNPELGDEASFARFCTALQTENLGLIVDFVPNHMGIGKADNAWWLDVLEWGEASPYAAYFDIDWSPPKPDLAGKVLLPILGKSYGAALCAGEIELRFDAAAGCFDFWYFDHRLPLCPRDYARILPPIGAPPTADDMPLADSLARLDEAALAGAATPYLRDVATMAKHSLAAAAHKPPLAQAIEAAVAKWRGVPGEVDSFQDLHSLLQRQAFRLAHWRTAADEINYRRFFDIDDLAGIRMDRVRVFRDTHEFIGRLVARGSLHGLRIDHVDGLADPQRYCRRLNAFAAAIAPRTADGKRLRPYIVVEKILGSSENLRPSWPVSGTTGYDYMALANALFVDPSGFAALQRIWSRFTGETARLDDEIYACRKLIIDRSFASEITYLVNWLVEIAEADWFTRDFTRKRLRDALTEIVAAFPLYRTYVTERGASDDDRKVIADAVATAQRRWSGGNGEFDFIESLLTLDIAQKRPVHYAAKRRAILRFVARFQQYTSAMAAKAIEDTLFYRHVPLVSANEVGSDPYQPAITPERFHAVVEERARYWPQAMLTSETHDTKRAEDVRARLNVLSEVAEEWGRRVARWHFYNRTHRSEIDGMAVPIPNDEYLLYETIVGSWPMRLNSLIRSNTALEEYIGRLKAYAIKACREAKSVSSWTMPNPAYEEGLVAFIDGIFAARTENIFLDSVLRFLPPIVRLGAINGLAQLTLKATLPGVPDFYQGSEFWDFSLVDPDNRRPVDFEARTAALRSAEAISLDAAKERWRDGTLKLWAMHALLRLRERLPALFLEGSYEPLRVEAEPQNRLLAFRRRHDRDEIIVVVARHLAQTAAGRRAGFWADGDFFADARLSAIDRRFTNLFSGEAFEPGQLEVRRVLAQLPVAVLWTSGT